jgi:hypothetical protein
MSKRSKKQTRNFEKIDKETLETGRILIIGFVSRLCDFFEKLPNVDWVGSSLTEQNLWLWESETTLTIPHSIVFSYDGNPFRVFLHFRLVGKEKSVAQHMKANWDAEKYPHMLYPYINCHWIQLNQGKGMDPFDGSNSEKIFLADSFAHHEEIEVFPHHYHLYHNNKKLDERFEHEGDFFSLIKLFAHHINIETTSPGYVDSYKLP